MGQVRTNSYFVNQTFTAPWREHGRPALFLNKFQTSALLNEDHDYCNLPRRKKKVHAFYQRLNYDYPNDVFTSLLQTLGRAKHEIMFHYGSDFENRLGQSYSEEGPYHCYIYE